LSAASRRSFAIEAKPSADAKPKIQIRPHTSCDSLGSNLLPHAAAMMHTLSQAMLVVTQARCDGGMKFWNMQGFSR
jgi:hypothetical protein